jgi:hypothetical protein
VYLKEGNLNVAEELQQVLINRGSWYSRREQIFGTPTKHPKTKHPKTK